MGKGWEIRYRGGNTTCATPSDLDLIVADAPRATGAEGSPSRYSIATWCSTEGVPPEKQPDLVFDLYDAERDVVVWVHWVPTRKQAAELLNARVCQSQRREIPTVRERYEDHCARIVDT